MEGLSHDNHDNHDHDGHDHDTGPAVVDIETALLAKNDQLAAHNRGWLAERGIIALNLMSSPGSGKTTLLRRTIAELAPARAVAVIEGDQETLIDAERIRAHRCARGPDQHRRRLSPGCRHAAPAGWPSCDPPDGSLVFIENVGNLVCPALFDLGERAKVVVVSVTEGEDKPLKYPHMFAAADLVVVNKIDLLPYVDFDVERSPRTAGRSIPAWPCCRCRRRPARGWQPGANGS